MIEYRVERTREEAFDVVREHIEGNVETFRTMPGDAVAAMLLKNLPELEALAERNATKAKGEEADTAIQLLEQLVAYALSYEASGFEDEIDKSQLVNWAWRAKNYLGSRKYAVEF